MKERDGKRKNIQIFVTHLQMNKTFTNIQQHIL